MCGLSTDTQDRCSLRTFFAWNTELGHKSDSFLLEHFYLLPKKKILLINAVSCLIFLIIPGNSENFGKIEKNAYNML